MAGGVTKFEEYSVSCDTSHQSHVNSYFDAESSYWKRLYTHEKGVVGEIIRDRHDAALRLIDRLALPAGSQLLEVGCGAGYMAIEMDRRGHQVHATDASEMMVRRARRNAEQCGASTRLAIDRGDVHNLNFAEASLDLVIAIGVIPWIDDPEAAINEAARVTKPGGYALFTSANRMELRNLLDPWRYPFLRPLKLRLKDAIEGAGIRRATPAMTFHSIDSVDTALTKADLQKITGLTVGFGPFSLFGRPLLPNSIAIQLHRRLQPLADRGILPFRATGMSYLVLARKRG